MAGTELVLSAVTDRALRTDLNRLHPRAGEVLVRIDAYADDRDPNFPALVDEWTPAGRAVPRFRREVAEAVVAWINGSRRDCSPDNEWAYWEGDVIAMISPAQGDCEPERTTPDSDGRYSIGQGSWVWSVWHPDKDVYHEALNTFPSTNAVLDIWRRYPDVTEDEDDATDYYACSEASNAFARYVARRGLRTWLVRGDDCESLVVGVHWWVAVQVGTEVYNVDWTARQFYNLEQPPNPQHANIPFPLIWRNRTAHPVAGIFATITPHALTTQESTDGP